MHSHINTTKDLIDHLKTLDDKGLSDFINDEKNSCIANLITTANDLQDIQRFYPHTLLTQIGKLLGTDQLKKLFTDRSSLYIIIRSVENASRYEFLKSLGIENIKNVLYDASDLISLTGTYLDNIDRDNLLKDLGGKCIMNLLKEYDDFQEFLQFSLPSDLFTFVTKVITLDHIRNIFNTREKLEKLMGYIRESMQVVLLIELINSEYAKKIIPTAYDLKKFLKTMTQWDQTTFLQYGLTKDYTDPLFKKLSDLIDIIHTLYGSKDVRYFMKYCISINTLAKIIKSKDDLNSLQRAMGNISQKDLEDLLSINITFSDDPVSQEPLLTNILNEYKTSYDSDPIKLRATIPIEEMWRFFIDGVLQAKDNWIGFEKREPGYLLAMINAFQIIFDMDSKLDLELIKKIHKVATKDVSNTNYDKHGTKGEFRKELNTSCSYGISHGNSTKDGILEILDDVLKNNDCKFIKGIELSQSESKADLDNEDILKYKTNPEKLDMLGISYHFRFFTKGKDEKAFVETVLDFIKTYEKNINAEKSPINKLIAIIKLIRDCERLHPFSDANCRTFCMILTNYLLIRNGFPLAIQNNPNCFDGCTVLELTSEILDGMNNTFNLIKNKSLYDVKTSDILKNVTEDQKKYFNAAMTIESLNRDMSTEKNTDTMENRKLTQ